MDISLSIQKLSVKKKNSEYSEEAINWKSEIEIKSELV